MCWCLKATFAFFTMALMSVMMFIIIFDLFMEDIHDKRHIYTWIIDFH